MIKQLLAACICVFATSQLSAQCTPDAAYADSTFGIWPDTTQNLDCAYADDPDGYEQVIDLKTLTDTTFDFEFQGQQLNLEGYIQAFRILSIDGLPEGFVYIPNTNEWTNGGSAPPFTPVQGCVSIVANQSTLQSIIASNPNGVDFPLTVVVDVKIHSTDNALANLVLSDTWLSDPSLENIPGIGPIEAGGYVIKVRPTNDGSGCEPLSISKISNKQFELEGNFPNPFYTSTDIRFSTKTAKPLRLEVRNMVGKLILEKNINAKSGANSVKLKSDKLIPGVYFYSLIDGNQVVTKRMVVASN